MRFRFAFPVVLAGLVAFVPLAARDPVTPEQRIERLEKQLRQVQRQVFPKGQPADTAGFSDEPAATQSAVGAIGGRLDAIERQMADLVRSSEENGNRLSVMEAEVARLRADQDRRLRALENGAGAATAGNGDALPPQQQQDTPDASPVAPDPLAGNGPPPRPQPKVETKPPAALTGDAAAEAAYDAGFHLWTAGKYDEAIKSLSAMAKKYPDSRRASWAYNLAGRAMLDKGQPRAAAEALLANYRRDPKGERAPDSLYYLGQALVKLGQPSQACKAYGELQDVYGASLRGDLKKLLPAARAEAKCS